MPIGRGGGVMQNAGATPLVWGALTAMGKGLGGLSSAWPRDTRLFSTAWLAQRWLVNALLSEMGEIRLEMSQGNGLTQLDEVLDLLA